MIEQPSYTNRAIEICVLYFEHFDVRVMKSHQVDEVVKVSRSKKRKQQAESGGQQKSCLRFNIRLSVADKLLH